MSRTLISLPENFLEQVDKFAVLDKRTRSELIREALRYYVSIRKEENPSKFENIDL